jgi:hypothetical protein
MSLSPVRQPSARETVSSAKSVTVCPVPLPLTWTKETGGKPILQSRIPRSVRERCEGERSADQCDGSRSVEDAVLSELQRLNICWRKLESAGRQTNMLWVPPGKSV